MNDTATIVVVDDAPDTLAFVVGRLRATGFDVRPIDSGERALGEIAASPPDLVLLDVRMHGMDGLEVCKRLKANVETRHIPVILMSGSADVNEWASGLELGAADYINKPFQTAELLARVRTHVALGSAMRSVEEKSATLAQANQRLEDEIVARQSIENELRRSLDRTERSRRALLSALEDQKRADSEILASEVRYRRLFESAKDGFLIVDAHTGRVIDVNPFLLDLLGYAHEDFFGKSIWDLDPLKDIVSSKKSFQELQETKYVRYDGLSLKRRDGREIIVELVSNEYSAGLIRVVQWNIRDITERMRSENELRRVNNFLDSIVENIPNMVYLKDAWNLRYVRINRAGEELLGYSRDSLLGKADHDFFSKSLADYLTAKDREVLGQKEVVDIPEEPVQTWNRGERIVHTMKVPLFGRQGEPEYLLGISEDITERKHAQDAIWNLSLRLEAILAAVPEILMEVDTNKVYTWANDAGLRFFGEDVLGKPAESFFVDKQETYEIVRPIFEGSHDAVYTESLQRRRDGEPRLLAWWSRALRDASGNLKGALSSARDITEIRKAEAERKKLEEQLQVSQKMEAIGSLAGGVAHDFNNLLCVLLSYTEFALRDSEQGKPVKDDLLAVKRAGERAAALTRQLLAFSRKQVLQPVPLIINDVATAMERMLRRIVGEDIEYVQSLAPDLGVVRADQGQLEQVLMNLVVNARDAMPEGGKLVIETRNVEIDEDFTELQEAVAAGHYVEIAVSDTGTGIDEHTKAHMFEPFFTTKEKGKGTGLGLATVYGIVKQSGGGIYVASEVGKGTTFRIYLPRDEASVATVARSVAGERRSAGTETILLVEDEEEMRQVAHRSLEAAGYTVMSAADGEEALRVSGQYSGDIHLLLTDVVMPRMGGRLLAQQLTKTRPAISVLFMSGYTDGAILHHGLRDAGIQFLAKPFTSTGLAQRVRQVLDGSLAATTRKERRTGETAIATDDLVIDEAVLQALDEEVVGGLRVAAQAARYDEILEIVESLRPGAPSLAEAIHCRVDRFDYQGILALMSRWRNGGTP